jgi:ribosomal protein S18 acetylase RimI-like enzyme
MPSKIDSVIRLATEADAAFLARFAARLFRETFAKDNTPEDMAFFLANTFTEQKQREELTDPRGVTLFIDVEGETAGYAQLRDTPLPDCIAAMPAPIELARFYIDAAWHGRGLAQALMTAVDDVATARGARSLWLGVWEHNARAQAFYRKFNFVPVGSHVFLLGTDEQTDVLMARPLPAANA